jgi:sucrose-6-phosphate hydrolase SacC (GH32 family)
MTTWMKDCASKMTGGALSLATSPDLTNWTDHGAVIYPGDMGPPECPQMFPLGGRWYALASIWGTENGVGRPTYWTSESPMGPWAKKPTGVLDGRHNCAAQVAFDGGVPLLFGWIPTKPGVRGKPNSWGGHLAIPREIYALPDGSLGSRLPQRLRKRLEEMPWREVPGFPVTAEPRPLGGTGAEAWQDVAAEFTLQMPMATRAVRIGIAPLGEVVIERGRIRILDAAGEVGSEIGADIPDVSAVPVHIFVEAGIVEVFVNDRHSLVARLPAREGARRLTVRGEGAGASVGDARTGAINRVDQ